MVSRVTPEQFAALFPHVGASLQSAYHAAFDGACVEFEINTSQRLAAFFAQIGHESGGLKFMEELGGPMYFRKYEGRADLGNTMPGDGVRYHGRGPIQLTGRANYRRVGTALGIKLEDYPELAKSAAVGSRIAAYFWREAGCNELADIGDMQAITRKINGGTNGLADRMERWGVARKVMGLDA